MSILTASLLYDFLVLVATLIIALVAYIKWNFTFWERTGVPTVDSPPTIPFGHAKKIFLRERSMGEIFRDYYIEFKDKGLKYGGVFFGMKPFFIPADPDLVKHIMQIDFGHFVNHGGWVDEENDPLSGHLFGLENDKWRNMRIKLTPTFTSGKMKMMFQTLADCTVGLKEIMDNSSVVDIKDVLARFTTDIIGSVAFGIECNSLKDPDSLFRKNGDRIFNPTIRDQINAFLPVFLPRSVLKAINYKVTNPGVERFFTKTVADTVAYREQNNVYRKDFMHLLLQLKNRGKVADDGNIKSEDEARETLSMNQVVAQSFVFFAAGFETSSTTMTFALYELALHQDIQDKVREEVCTVLEKHDDQMTYNAIMEMTYMDLVLYETLRKYPPLGLLVRECTKDYTIPGTSTRIPKGTNVGISAMGLHMDPEFYPNPTEFDPERFTEENKKTRPAFTWIPFGEGPRICIGLRFGLMQSKVGLTALLKNYKITLNSNTKTPITINKSSFITAAQEKILLDVEKLN